MKFEEQPTDEHEHGLVFEAELHEVEAVAALYRERIFLFTRENRLVEVYKFERDLSEWSGQNDETFLTNNPLGIAKTLEHFYSDTKLAVKEIVTTQTEPAFDSDAIARRIRLGEKAYQIAGLIRLQYDSETLAKILDEGGADVFMPTEKSKKTIEE